MHLADTGFPLWWNTSVMQCLPQKAQGPPELPKPELGVVNQRIQVQVFLVNVWALIPNWVKHDERRGFQEFSSQKGNGKLN